MSEIKTNKISPRKGTTTTITDSGDTVTVSSGANINNAGNLTISNLTNSGAITSSGTLTTAGISGSGTINNTTGTITGLKGAVNWQTGSIKTASFTASANEGYFLNTTSGQITVTLPASPTAGDVVGVKDYADTFDTNKLELNANGNKIQGSTTNFDITVEGTAAILLYVDSTKGWLLVDQSKAADISEAASFTAATGGTITTSGDFKIHTFTSPGTFCVSSIGNGPTNPNGGPNTVSYLVLAGGGGSQNAGAACGAAAGGGGGGFREGRDIAPSYTASPLVTTGLTITKSPFPVTVGGGGASGGGNQPNTYNNGSNSVFSTITSAGGGTGTSYFQAGGAGGSGGGGSSGGHAGGSGNTPPVSPPQGNSGGSGLPVAWAAGGGGGAGGSGGNALPSPSRGGNAGAGVTTHISGSPVGYAGGGNGRGDSGNGSSQTPFGGASPSQAAAANRGGAKVFITIGEVCRRTQQEVCDLSGRWYNKKVACSNYWRGR